MAEATIAAVAGGFGNIGYMGPGLALATLGPAATVPVALIFCFDTLLLFTLVPLLMALARRSTRASPQPRSTSSSASCSTRSDRHRAGCRSAAIHFEPPVALDRLMQFLRTPRRRARCSRSA